MEGRGVECGSNRGRVVEKSVTRNIKLVLEYDGAAFYGFQRQPRHHTVQETLEKALSQLLNAPVRIHAASGRTDTGVHAMHQVVNFKTVSPLATHTLQRGLNALLPKTLAVRTAEEVEASFHARYDARFKVYEYRIWNDAVRSPLRAGHAWHVSQKLDRKAMRQAMAALKGRHDFRSFCAAHGSAKTTVRTIRRLSLRRQDAMLFFRVEADGFLYHMVRNIVGTLVEVGRGKIRPEDVRKILRACDRKQAGPTAPPGGLTLASVTY